MSDTDIRINKKNQTINKTIFFALLKKLHFIGIRNLEYLENSF